MSGWGFLIAAGFGIGIMMIIICMAAAEGEPE